MKVRELIKKLHDYNPDAIVKIGHNRGYDFYVGWMGCDGGTKENAAYVYLDVAELNSNENCEEKGE